MQGRSEPLGKGHLRVETRGGIQHVARDMASDVGPRGGGGEGVGVRNEVRG